MTYIKNETKEQFINQYGKLPTDAQYIKLFEINFL